MNTLPAACVATADVTAGVTPRPSPWPRKTCAPSEGAGAGTSAARLMVAGPTMTAKARPERRRARCMGALQKVYLHGAGWWATLGRANRGLTIRHARRDRGAPGGG